MVQRILRCGLLQITQKNHRLAKSARVNTKTKHVWTCDTLRDCVAILHGTSASLKTLQLEGSLYLQLEGSLYLQLEGSLYLQLEGSLYLQLEGSLYLQLEGSDRLRRMSGTCSLQLTT